MPGLTILIPADPSAGGILTAPSKQVNGTALLPAYSFASDSSAGMWLAGGNNLAFSSHGLLGFYIDAAQATNFSGAINGGLAAINIFQASGNSAAFPSFTGKSASSANTSGMYFPTTTSVGFSTNGISAGTIDATQNWHFVGTAQIQAGGTVRSGTVVPNSNVVGNVGDIYLCTTGGASVTLWVKESGAGTNTGWVGK